jgi:hypothetical protein
MSKQTTRYARHPYALLAAILVCAASCKGKGAPTPAPSASAGPAVTLAPGRPRTVSGTAAGIHEYLSTVDTVSGATFDVTWRPEVVRIDRASALRSLQGVSPDGQTFQFAADEPALAQVKPGTILLVWGVALGRVVTVTPRAGAVIIRTEVAAITDAIDHGHIAWKVTPDFSHGLITPSYPKPDTLKVSALPPAPSTFRFASYTASAPTVPAAPFGGFADAAPLDGGDSGPPPDQIPVAALDILKGTVASFEYEVGYLYGSGGLDFDLQARRKNEAGDAGEAGKEENKKIIEGLGNQETRKPEVPPPAQGTQETPEHRANDATKQSMLANKEWEAAKKGWDRKTTDLPPAVWGALPNLVGGTLWETAVGQLDLRIKAQGHLDGLDLGGDISISNSREIASKFQFDNISGLVNFQYLARLGSEQGLWAEKLKASVPVTFNIPILIGGIPFMFQIGVNIYAVPGISSKLSTMQGQFHLNFAGNGVVQAGKGNLDASGAYEGNAFIVEEGSGASSIGVSALLVSVQFPRLGFGMGLFNAYSIAFIDFIGTGSVLTSGHVGIMPCKRYQIDAGIGAGVATQVLGLEGIPIVGKLLTDKVNQKLSWRKQPDLWHYQHIETRPEGLNCEFKG